MKKILFILFLFLMSVSFVGAVDSVVGWPVGEGLFDCGLSGGRYSPWHEIRVFTPGEIVTISGAGRNGVCSNRVGRTLALGTDLEGSNSWMFYYWNLDATVFSQEQAEGSVSRSATLPSNQPGIKYVTCLGASFAPNSHNMMEKGLSLRYYVDNPPRITRIMTEPKYASPGFFLNFFTQEKRSVRCGGAGRDGDGDVVFIRFRLMVVEPNHVPRPLTNFTDYYTDGLSFVDRNVIMQYNAVLPVGSKIFCEAELINEWYVSVSRRSYTGVELAHNEILSRPWVVN